MASLRAGSSALRASMAAPSTLRQAAFSAARAYSSKSAVRLNIAALCCHSIIR